MTTLSNDLDPVTLRAVAVEMDVRADHYGQQCRCALHEALTGVCLKLANDLRTLAIRITQARTEARQTGEVEEVAGDGQ